jgi:hypothetical protein
MASAAAYSDFRTKWFGPIRVHAEFLLGSVDPIDARRINEPMEKLVRVPAKTWVSKKIEKRCRRSHSLANPTPPGSSFPRKREPIFFL